MASVKDLLIKILVDDKELDKAGKSAEGMGKRVAGIAVAAGAALGGAAVFANGWSQAMDLTAATSKMQAQLGLTGEQSQRAGRVAGDLYASGFGESSGQMATAVSAVMSSIKGMSSASAGELESVTAGVQSISDAFEIDVGRAAQVAGQMVKTGFAKDATGALDLLAASMQKVPANVRADVLDAVDEYGPFFQQLGISGETAMKMLVDASAKGMYGIDKTGDALKEFTIRATDMSKKTGAVYKTLGMDQTTMTNDLLAGGDRAEGAFSKIILGLQNIKDPAAQSQAALALFGTPLEDLSTGEIPGFIDQLANMDGGLGNTQGAAQKLTDQMSGTKDPMESLRRSFMSVITDGLTPFVGPAKEMATVFRENPALIQGVVIGLGLLTAAMVLANVATTISAGVQAARTLVLGTSVAAETAATAANVGLAASLWATTWPILAVVAAIALLALGAYLIVTNWDKIGPFFAGIWDGIVQGAQGAWNWVVDSAVGAYNRFIDTWNGVSNFFGSIGSSITNAFKGALRWVAQAWNMTVGSLSWTVPGWIPGVGGQVWRVPQMPVLLAKGGIVTGPTLALIGEGGQDEAVIPLGRGGSGGGLVTVPIRLVVDGRVLAEAVESAELRRGW